MIVLANGVENRTRSVCRMTIVPMLRVGMPFVTLCVTMLRRTACSRSDAERPGLRYHAQRGMRALGRSARSIPRLWRPRQAIHVDPPRTGVAQ